MGESSPHQENEQQSQMFTAKKLLVTGGAGFIGGNLLRTLLEGQPREIVVVDNLLSAERSSLLAEATVTFIEGSIADDAVLDALPRDIDYVFHLATYHGNQSSIHDPLADHQNNLLPTLKLWEHIKGFPSIQKVVYSSAGCTVAEKTFDTASATTEDAPVSLWMDSPYQISKIAGELYSNYYYTRHGTPVVKARFQNVYGPGEVLGAGRWRGTPATVWRNVTPTFIYRAIQGMPLTVEDQGTATRDFIYVGDIVRGLIECALSGVPGDTYNLASGVETSILELADLVNRLAGNPAGIELRAGRDWDSSGKRFGSTDKARHEIGFEARVDLKEGVTRTVDWTRQNLDMIDTTIRKHDEHLHRAG